MRRLVLTGYDEAMAALGDLSTPGKAAYAARWGHDFEAVRDFLPGSHPSWQKLRLLIERLPAYEEILWLDADALITNPQVDVFSAYRAHPLVASQDWGECPPERLATHFSMAAFIARPGALPYFAQAATKTRWANSGLWDQDAMQETARESQQGFLWILPRRALNAVPAEMRPNAPEPWQPGDFLAHCTSERMGERIAWMEGVRK